jgi:hypothetical protein
MGIRRLNRVRLVVGEAQLSLVSLALPQVCRGRLGDDLLRHAQVAGKPPHLRLVQIAHGVQVARHVAPKGRVPQQPLRAVAGPHHQRVVARGLIVEYAHPLPRHLVGAADAVGLREALEVRVNLGRDLDDLVLDTQRLGHAHCVLQRVRRAGLVGEHERDQVVRPQRPRRDVGAGRGIDATRESYHAGLSAGGAHLLPDELNDAIGDVRPP